MLNAGDIMTEDYLYTKEVVTVDERTPIMVIVL